MAGNDDAVHEEQGFLSHLIELRDRLLPAVERYPEAYVRRVLDPGYRPSANQLIDDYLTANPTRRRPLDLLPVLAEIDGERVRRTLGGDDTKAARPAVHFRLPSSRIDHPDWTLASEWNRWILIEQLSSERDYLAAMCEAYLSMGKRPLTGLDTPWLKRSVRWLEGLRRR